MRKQLLLRWLTGLILIMAAIIAALAKGQDPPIVYAFERDLDDRQNELPDGVRPGYLIVGPRQIIRNPAGALNPILEEFVVFKQGLGFNVYTQTIEHVTATMPGRDVAEQLREYLKLAHQWNTEGPSHVRYVLLIGDRGVIPIRRICPKWRDDLQHIFDVRPNLVDQIVEELDQETLSATLLQQLTDNDLDFTEEAVVEVVEAGHSWLIRLECKLLNLTLEDEVLRVEAQQDTGGPTRSDWYYADLSGDWDSNGDGIFGQGLQHNDPTDAVDLHYEVAVGRIPSSEQTVMETALRTIIDSESDGGPRKLQALVMGAFMELAHREWKSDLGAYRNKGTDTDNAVLMERIWVDVLLPAGMNRTRIYETTLNHNDVPPSLYPADYALGKTGVTDAWNAAEGYGLVNIASHGSHSGVSSHYWKYDYEAEGLVTGLIENPTHPISLEGEEPRSRSEIGAHSFLSVGMLDDLQTHDGLAPVVAISACGTAGFNDFDNPADATSLGANMLGFGKASAFYGALGTTIYQSGWDGPVAGGGYIQDALLRFNQLLLGDYPRVGDATWRTQMELADEVFAHEDMIPKTLIKHTLYGDPAMSYWGNAADFTAPWPMFRHDNQNSGLTTYEGPAIPEVKWQFPLNPSPFTGAVPSPIVGADGTIYAGNSQGRLFAINPDGSEAWHFDAQGAINAGPTLTLDGTLYFRAEDGYLYAITDDGQLRWREPVEFIPGSAGPTQDWPPFANAPRVSPAGAIYALAVPDAQDLNTIFNAYGPGGQRWFATETANGGAAGTPALMPDDTLYFASWNGTLSAYDADGNLHDGFLLNAGALGSPAVGSNGDVHIGTRAGRLQVVHADMEENWHFDTPHNTAAINSSPAIGEDGSIYFGSRDHRVYALRSQWPRGLRWEFDTGGSVDSSPALDDTAVYVVGGATPEATLFALERDTGAERWAIPIGGSALWGSSPAIGYGKMIYVVSQTGQLYAVGPAGPLPPSDALARPISPFEIGISWRDNSDEEASFNLERRTGWSEKYKTVATLASNKTSYLDTDLRPNTTYFYRLQALRSAHSGYSNETHAHTPRERPLAPGGLAAAAESAYSLRLTWSNVDPNALGVLIYRSDTAAGPYNQIGMSLAGGKSFVDFDPLADADNLDSSSPRPGQTYFYQLRAFNDQGKSPPSAATRGSTKGLGLPALTDLMVRRPSPSRVLLSWRNPAAECMGIDYTDIIVERTSDEMSGFEIVATLPSSATSFEDNLERGWVAYRVRAASPTDDSPYVYSSRVYFTDSYRYSGRIYQPLIAGSR